MSLLLDPNGDIQWVSFEESDFDSTGEFVRFVRPGDFFFI